jgi:glycosyltransferase involved in cell wall biosynthesis
MTSSVDFLSTSTSSPAAAPFVVLPPRTSAPAPAKNPRPESESCVDESLDASRRRAAESESVPQFAKVLHIINGEHFSGAERVQQLLGKSLQRFGVRAEFACIKPGRFPELCGLEASQISVFPMSHRLDVRIAGQLAQKVRTEQFDLLHAHTPRSALVAALVSSATGLPWCYHVHSPASRDSTRGLVNRVNGWMEWFSVRSCTKLFTVSQSLLQEMLRQGIPQSQLVLVPNGVPAIEPIHADSRKNHSTWRLGIIALMRPRKGVEIALEALKQLSLQRPDIELELIGGFENESYQREILGSIQQLGLQNRVVWSGFTTDIPRALHRLDALLLPSLFGEGMPMVVLEALAAAVPVVATRVEGTPEVVRDGVEGLLAEPRSVESLAEKISVLTNDRKRWAQYSRSALLRHRTHFTDREMARRVAEVYREVVLQGMAAGIPT